MNDGKTLISLRIKRNHRRVIVETVQAILIVAVVCFVAGVMWTIKSCMGMQP
jgi:hypothetical protein